MRARWWWTVLIVALASVTTTAVWQATMPSRHLSAPALPRHGSVPDFSLIDQRHQPVTSSTLRGAPWIAAFIFTRCGGQCPIMTSRLIAIQRALPATSPVRFVCVSVDPTYDTPDVLARYAKARGADGPQWHWLTGSWQTILHLSRAGFHLGVEAEGGAPEEPIIHSVRLVLVDAQNRIRGYYDGTDAGVVARMVRDIPALSPP